MDERFNFSTRLPEGPHYWIFRNRDGTRSYYAEDMPCLYRFMALYGPPRIQWSYSNEEADETFL